MAFRSTMTRGTEPNASQLYSQSRLRPVQARMQPSDMQQKPAARVESVRLSPRAPLEELRQGTPQTKSFTRASSAPLHLPEAPQAKSSDAIMYTDFVEAADSSLDDAEGDGEPERSEEFVVALHDFSSNNDTCLSFVSGEVIRVFNRDESGWWDGELDGQRGWFPSNYVDERGLSADDLALISAAGEQETTEESSVDGGSIMTSENGVRHSSSLMEGTPASSSSQHTATYATIGAASAARQPQQTLRGLAPSRSSTPTTANSLMMQFVPEVQSRTASVVIKPARPGMRASVDASHLPSILEPIHHAISLLHNAVRANRIAHFQPSTACVISSVRSVLSSADCLTRESAVLKAHPVLAKERKHILAELSKLVTQARRASTPTKDDEAQYDEMEAMLRMADQVLFNVRRFVEVAVECDVAIPDRPSSAYDDQQIETSHDLQVRRSSGNGASSINRVDLDKTPTPDSPRSSTYRTAFTSSRISPRSSRSYADLRTVSAHYHQMQSSSMAPLMISQAARIKAQAMGRPRLHSPPDETTGNEQHSPCSSPPLDGPVPTEPRDFAPAEIMERIQHANDHLLSIIAAFIGHIHGHTRESHASSYAFLIDMTRATVDGVRTMLVIVEAVHGCEALLIALPRQMGMLWESREAVYEATASLVTSARIITSSSNQSGTAPHSGSDDGDDDDKTNLLQAATAVLRTGGECVGAIKMCLVRAEPSLRITLAMPASMLALRRNVEEAATPTSMAGSTSSLEDEENEEAGESHLQEAGNNARRGKHTLSYLGRKATSLNCLRERYENDPVSTVRAPRFEDIPESGCDTVSTPASESLTELTVVTPGAEGSGGSSDSSEPMSREHSRASGSTLQSTHSITTPNTSARPSMERVDLSLSQLQHITGHGEDGQTAPVSAPLLGSFPRPELTKAMSTSAVPPHVRNRSVSLPRGSNSIADEQIASASAQQDVDSAPLSSPTVSTDSSPTFPTPPTRVGRSLSSDARISAPDHAPSEVTYNSEGQLTGATLRALVEKMTPHNTTIDPTLSNAFFLCFRLFTTPTELFAELAMRYEMRAPEDIETNADDFARWAEHKVSPVRLRVFNFLKMWLESHWNAETDYCILDSLLAFTLAKMTHALHKPGMRLTELAQKRKSEGPDARILTMALKSDSPSASSTRGTGTLKRVVSTDVAKNAFGLTDIANLYTPLSMPRNGAAPPQPIVSKSLMNHLKHATASTKINVLDFDPLELARQLTIMESRIFCTILPSELLGLEFSKSSGGRVAANVKRMSTLSTHVTGWVTECILNEDDARKRTQLVKYFLKLGDRLLGLSNYNALFSVLAALNSSAVSRLQRTWDGLPSKYRLMLEQQRHLVDHMRNFYVYRHRLRATMAPALPFVGLILTDLTFCNDGNGVMRGKEQALLNFDRYVKMSRIVGDLQRFQTPYALMEVAEMQSYLRNTLHSAPLSNSADVVDDLYNRSLRLEPRRTQTMPHSNDGSSTTSHSHASISRAGLAGVSGLDIFNWK